MAGLRKGSNWQDVQWGLFMSKYIFPGADASTPLYWYTQQLEMAGFEVHSVENIGRHYSHTLKVPPPPPPTHAHAAPPSPARPHLPAHTFHLTL